eukprot:71984-Prymnesium_polylepis.1
MACGAKGDGAASSGGRRTGGPAGTSRASAGSREKGDLKYGQIYSHTPNELRTRRKAARHVRPCAPPPKVQSSGHVGNATNGCLLPRASVRLRIPREFNQ